MGGGVGRCTMALLMFAVCSPADGDRQRPTSESVAERATDAADANRVAATKDAATGAGGEGDYSR